MTLSHDAPHELEDALRALGQVDVVVGAPETAVLVEGRVAKVRPQVVSVREAEAADVGPARLWLVDGVLDRALASHLEDLHIGFVDRGGGWWLPGMARTTTAGSSARRPRIRGPQIRMAQLLANHPSVEWTQRKLAARAGSTQQTAHRLLNRLEGEGLLEQEGAGRASRRVVRDRVALWAWLERACAPGRAGLASLFALLGGVGRTHLIIVGGLVPPLLAPEHAASHVGSADIDFCLSVAITEGRTAH